MEKEKDMKKKQQKIAWSFLWDSPPEAQTSPMPRSRVAELLNCRERTEGRRSNALRKGMQSAMLCGLSGCPARSKNRTPRNGTSGALLNSPRVALC